MITPSNENIYPIGARLLVEKFRQAKETTEGLEMSEGDGYSTSVLGTVIRCGDKCVSFGVGDVLMWRRYSVDDLKVYTGEGEKEYSLIDESEVIAKVCDPVVPPDKHLQINLKKNATKETASIEEEVSTSEESAEKR